MDVQITSALKQQLEADNLNYQELIDEFREWKSGNEFGSYHFGKDGAYDKPRVNGERDLRHVHLIPIFDTEQLVLWNKVFARKGQKTSDRALVYTKDNKGNYLLIFILSEDAHKIARRETAYHNEIMENFAIVAEAFIYDGEVA